jgi:hypothetical protein
MSKLTADFTTTAPAPCYARQAWTGPTPSTTSVPNPAPLLTAYRTKEKLRSGEMAVSGDQWPIFLYHGYSYDPDDPWNGLFRSSLLIYVSRPPIQSIEDTDRPLRHSSMCSHPLALSKRSRKLRDLVMLVSME